MAHRRRPRDPQTPRGTVYPLLDLHGHTGAEARLRAESWLRARAADGERTVMVVTGRGNRSQGLPVLRGEIEDLLAGLAGGVVSRWEPTDGGGGFRVQLRPAPSPSASDAAALLRGIPPDLLRRAEEALHDLGITPTPALLRAEARRIQSDGAG